MTRRKTSPVCGEALEAVGNVESSFMVQVNLGFALRRLWGAEEKSRALFARIRREQPKNAEQYLEAIQAIEDELFHIRRRLEGRMNDGIVVFPDSSLAAGEALAPSPE